MVINQKLNVDSIQRLEKHLSVTHFDIFWKSLFFFGFTKDFILRKWPRKKILTYQKIQNSSDQFCQLHLNLGSKIDQH